ncbi:MAG: serine hydrolase [Verrucomicrobiales bacterium]|nr:serine hydrolase [Verrucomicrobiales bacterium]
MVNADGRTTWSHGTLKWDDPTPVDENTLYEIASVSKTFTAVLLAEMEQSGNVGFDDLVSGHLPPDTPMPSNGGEFITLENLATHFSGLPTMNPAPECILLDPSNPFAQSTAGWLYGFVAAFELPRRPGTGFEYSNVGVGLLGNALATSQNTPFETLLKERVLTPLGMDDTTITRTVEQETRRAPGHNGYIVRPPFDMNDLAPAGGLFSTVNDLLTYLEHNIGLVPDSPLHSAMAETHLRRENQLVNGNLTIDVGLVWSLWNLGGGVVQHGGDSPGSAAFVGFRPSTGTGVVVLSNSRRHRYTDVQELGLHCLGVIPQVASANRPTVVSAAEKARYIGRYQTDDTEFVIGMDSGQLTLFSNGVEVTLYPQGNRRFSYLDIFANADLTFTSDGSSLSLSQLGTRLRLSRVRSPPGIHITRDCDDIVLRLLGELDHSYTIQSSTDGHTWTNLPPKTLTDPPHRQPIEPGTHLFRLAP